ncbi:MAG: hypothetical protein JWN24_1757 [Phycisphaerales bacterium]|nr:hypothetical protein [Phycisphaerales bacterium]
MKHDIEELKFGGVVHTIAEDELAASVTDDRDNKFIPSLYREYVAAGKPRGREAWIRERMKPLFAYVSHPPRWIARAEWPFFDGRPMTFVEQLDVPEFKMVDGRTAPERTLYVFCAGVSVTGVSSTNAWRMEHRVVAQYPCFSGLVERKE